MLWVYKRYEFYQDQIVAFYAGLNTNKNDMITMIITLEKFA